MFRSRRWFGWGGLAVLAAGCAPQAAPPAAPEPQAQPVLIYRLQDATVDWGGTTYPSTPYGRGWGYGGYNPAPSSPPRQGGNHSGSGWGRHYKWRGPGQPPSWYGHPERHVDDAFVQVGGYYYPYYHEESRIYPVYSMPYVYDGSNRLVPRYGELPEFGPYQLEPGQVRIIRHKRDAL